MKDTGESTLHFLDYWRVIRLRWALILTIFLLVTVTAGVVCYFVPREYYSQVLMEVKPDNTRLKIFSGGEGAALAPMGLVPTQFQILQSRTVLYPVIERLKLQEKWSKGGAPLSMEETYLFLRRKLGDVEEIRNTTMIRIGVYSVDPQEAADIANGVARSYQQIRERDQADRLDKDLKQLHEEVEKKRKAVDEASRTAQQIRVSKGIVDLNPETMEVAMTQESSMVMQNEKLVNEHRVMVVTLETQLEQTKDMTPEALMQALTTLNIQDPIVSKVLPVYQDIAVEEARLLNSGLGPNHPRLKALRAQKSVFGQQLEDQVQALRASLQTRLNVAKATLEAMEKKWEESKGEYQEARAQSIEYINAKANYVNAKRILDGAEARLEAERIQKGIDVIPAKIWDPAQPSNLIARPNVLAYMGMAMAFGLLIGVGLSFFLEYLDTSVKSMEDTEKVLDAPVLAVIPKNIHKLVDHEGDSVDAEVYRVLQTNMEFCRKNPAQNSLVMVSGGVGEGKSTTLNNLAVTCARGGQRVLVVDADFRRSCQHTLFNLTNTRGLADVLLGNATAESVTQKTSVPNLSLIPSGQTNKDWMGILSSRQMSDFVAKAKAEYDLVLFDSPPILGLADASVIVREVDFAIMVVQYRRFPSSMLIRVKQAVVQSGGHLLGAVLNNVDTRRDSSYQYYSQYYDYYKPDPVRGKKNEAAATAASSGGRRRPSSGGSDEY